MARANRPCNFCLQWHKDIEPIIKSLDRGSVLRRRIYGSDLVLGDEFLYHWHPSTWAADDNTAEAEAVGSFQTPTDAEDAVKHPGCGESEIPQPPVQADPTGTPPGGRLATPAHLWFDLSVPAVACWPAAYLKANLGFDEVGVDGRALIAKDFDSVLLPEPVRKLLRALVFKNETYVTELLLLKKSQSHFGKSRGAKRQRKQGGRLDFLVEIVDSFAKARSGYLCSTPRLLKLMLWLLLCIMP